MVPPEQGVFAGAGRVEVREIDGGHIFGIPTLDGGSVKVAPHASYGEMRDADELDRNVPPHDLDRINGLVADLLPGLVPTPVRVASYMDAYTPDAHAIVGAMPGVDNVWVLGGFSGHGFKMAPAFGRVAADQHDAPAMAIPHHRCEAARS